MLLYELYFDVNVASPHDSLVEMTTSNDLMVCSVLFKVCRTFEDEKARYGYRERVSSQGKGNY